jgi:hypothetical protein
MEKGYIYILKNPSFPDYIKIGYADNVENRLQQLNRSECTPFAFRVYATYEVNSRLSDIKIHSIIDRLNPNLRSIDNFNGQKRIREFYAMDAEEAYAILEAIAEIHGCVDKLVKWEQSEDELMDERTAEEVVEEKKRRAAPFSFDMCGIEPGSVLEFWSKYNQPTGITCTVIDNKNVEYDGQKYSLSGLATELLGAKWTVQGPCYYKYNGEWLNDIRDRKGQ